MGFIYSGKIIDIITCTIIIIILIFWRRLAIRNLMIAGVVPVIVVCIARYGNTLAVNEGNRGIRILGLVCALLHKFTVLG